MISIWTPRHALNTSVPLSFSGRFLSIWWAWNPESGTELLNTPMPPVKNMIGFKVGRLTVVSRAGFTPYGLATWNCICECGKETIASGSHLRRGASGGRATRSCGCLVADTNSAVNRRHGMDNSPTYRAWHAMKTRCTNPKTAYYENYGGRGITFCDKWKKFIGFLEDMGIRPEGTSLDRRDVNGNYEKDNCKWSTDIEQARNKRTTVYITFNGVKRCVAEWSEITGISGGVIRSRMLYGWPTEHLFDPPGSQGKTSKFPKLQKNLNISIASP